VKAQSLGFFERMTDNKMQIFPNHLQYVLQLYFLLIDKLQMKINQPSYDIHYMVSVLKPQAERQKRIGTK